MVLWTFGVGCCWGANTAWAEFSEVSITVTPGRYIHVDGDREKFRAHHWMDDKYDGGVKKFITNIETDNGTTIFMEGHAFVESNDYSTKLSIEKEDLGFLEFDFMEFRKYYDGTGGVYHLFSTYPSVELGKELELDIGHLAIEGGLTLESLPVLTLFYEREYKDGAKSRLTWSEIEEAIGTRNIVPVPQDIDEVVDTFAVGANHMVGGFEVSGEQRWEFVRSELFREELDISTTGGSGDDKIIRQDQDPQSTLMTSIFNIQRPWADGKAFTSLGYRFSHTDAQEMENLNTFDASGNPRQFSSHDKNYFNARADTELDTHTAVGHFSTTPWESVSFAAKLKAEHTSQEGFATYPFDGDDPPNGTIDRTDTSDNDNRVMRYGESLSARFTGIPRTTLYAEGELEQSRSHMRENRTSVDGPDAGDDSSANEVFNRRTITDVRRGAATVGAHIAPWSFLNITTHVRHKKHNNDYDDQEETSPGGSTARSAFMDEQNVETNEVATRVTLRPHRRVRVAGRYQYQDQGFFTRVEDQSPVETDALSHIFTVDVTLQPFDDLLLTGSFSRQDIYAQTTNDLTDAVAQPTFNADVDTWLTTLGYTVTENVHVSGAFQYSTSDNFNDFSGSTGLPLGADYERVDTTATLLWTINEDTSLELDYAFYHYASNPNVEVGDYDAHAVWLEFTRAL